MRICLYIIILIIVVSANRSPRPRSRQNITDGNLIKSQVQQFMWDNDLTAPAELIVDRFYGLPTKEWIHSELLPALKQELEDRGLSSYQSESNDCDDVASRARLLAQELNNKSSNRGIQAIAVGEYHYVQDISKECHCINFAIIKMQGKPKLLFFEPRTATIGYLTKSEILSCYAWII